MNRKMTRLAFGAKWWLRGVNGPAIEELAASPAKANEPNPQDPSLSHSRRDKACCPGALDPGMFEQRVIDME
jgi:hypothetical protein